MDKKWRTYEEVAQYLLNSIATEFGLERVEGKQGIQGNRSGTTYRIDAKGICQGNERFVIVECRRYTTSKQSQDKLGELAYRIIDSGADGGIIVSPLGLQTGAEKIAAAENVVNVQLDANCTPTQFVMQFLNKIFVGVEMSMKMSMSLSSELISKCTQCGRSFSVVKNEKTCPDCQ